jgi:hypothetical protein
MFYSPKKERKFLVYWRFLSAQKLTRPMTIDTTTAAKIAKSIVVYSGASADSCSSGSLFTTA